MVSPALACLVLWSQAPVPSELAAEAKLLEPGARSALAKSFLEAALKAPPYAPRTLYRKGRSREFLAPAEFEKLEADSRKPWQAMAVPESMYQGLFYGTPLAYLPALEQLSERGGAAGWRDLKDRKVIDFGHGGIGQLRLFADLGAVTIGVDVDPIQPKLYGSPGDQGAIGSHGGTVKLVHGKFPVDPAVTAAIGEGADLFLSKNTLKNGYLHPAQKVDPRVTLDIGCDDATLLAAIRKSLKPGGLVVIYNVTSKPTPPGPDYLPQTDGRCPFLADDLTKAGFDTIVRDHVDDAGIRGFGRAVGWDKPPYGMNLEEDLFALVTILRRR
jgi:hypothetical protein